MQQEPRTIGGTDSIYVWPIFAGLCKGVSQQNIAKNMVQYLHFRILKFPLIMSLCMYLSISKQLDFLIPTPKKIKANNEEHVSAICCGKAPNREGKTACPSAVVGYSTWVSGENHPISPRLCLRLCRHCLIKTACLILYFITLYHIISYYIILYHIISYYIILYHIVSYYIILYHIISYYIILYYI